MEIGLVGISELWADELKSSRPSNLQLISNLEELIAGGEPMQGKLSYCRTLVSQFSGASLVCRDIYIFIKNMIIIFVDNKQIHQIWDIESNLLCWYENYFYSISLPIYKYRVRISDLCMILCKRPSACWNKRNYINQISKLYKMWLVMYRIALPVPIICT